MRVVGAGKEREVWLGTRGWCVIPGQHLEWFGRRAALLARKLEAAKYR